MTATVLTLVLLPILYDRFAMSRAEVEAEEPPAPAPQAHPASRPAAAE